MNNQNRSWGEMYDRPIAQSIVFDKIGHVSFLTTEAYPLTKTIIDFEYPTDYFLRIKLFGQKVPAILNNNLTWDIIINEIPDYTYQNISDIIGLIEQPCEILLAKFNVRHLQVNVTYTVNPTLANADLACRLQGFFSPMIR